MKLSISDEWIKEKAKNEDGCEISAGGFLMTDDTQERKHMGWRLGKRYVSETSIVSEETGASVAYAIKEKDAQRIVTAVNAYEPMLEALKGLDAFWTADFPDGPETELREGFSLSEETVVIWKQIRKAINLAEGKEGGAGE